MEEDPACCVLAGGAMSKLAAKLDGLLIRSNQGRRPHMPIPWEVKNVLIPLIKQNLESMMAIIHDGSDDNSSKAVIRCLTKEMRELSYDIHDCIDEHAAGPAGDHATRLLWRMERHVRVAKAIDKRRPSTVLARRRTSSKPITSWLSQRLKGRLWLLDKMREFSARSAEALGRYDSFNRPLKKQRNDDNHGNSDTRSGESLGSWSSPSNAHLLHRRVGIHDLALNTLKAWLTDGDGDIPKLKVVSMVGCGGVGKTTLANELYRGIGGQFECRAFVRMSQKPDVRRLLIGILSQIRPQQPPGNWKVHNLIGDIRAHLQDKRYLIVIDDVWARSTWDIVNRAFPDGNHCSRILITSELEDVALNCCGYEPQYVYKIKPLSKDDSRKLFYSIVGCPQELREVSNSVIRKCGGLPLAIVTFASLLASRMGKPEQREYVEYVDKSLGYGLMTNPTSEGLKQMVNLSYRNLPQHLKACMLYLCIFPEGYIIWTDDLVKQWIVEGFICATEGKDEEEISRGYFDELISSRLIHPIHIDGNDKVLSCTMHHTMRNHIMQESIVENFVAAIDYSQTATRFAHKVRRLSLHFGNAEDATLTTNMRLSQVRTLAFFGGFKCVPSFTEFRLLQILILHFWGEEESTKFDLTSISEMFRLRYLQVTCNVKLEIQQMQMLRHLQYLDTLKIDAARGSIIPSDVIHLPRLLHLRLPAETNLLSGIGHMTSLRTLGHFDLCTNSIDKVRDLGELTNVQDLQLTCTPMGPSHYLVKQVECLSLVLAKLNNLKCLTLKRSRVVDLGRRASSMNISCDVLSSVSSPPTLLQRLEWLPRVCTFSSLPEWIGHLGKLCILKIGVRELVRNDVDLLKGLPTLSVLSLYVHTKPAEIIVFTKGGFLVLKYFRFRCTVPCLKFEVDVMPNLRKLKLGFDAHGTIQYGPIPAGLDHLSGLEEISAKIGGANANGPVRRIVESALSDAIRMHPGRPTINMQYVNQIFGDRDDQNIRPLQEEKVMTPQKQFEPIEEDSNEPREDAASRLVAMDFGDDQEGGSESQQQQQRRKRYHRQTPRQIQTLEAMFKECPHPDENQRVQLSRELGLEARQIKFWFQNRVTQMKSQHERADNCFLRAENDKIRCENIAMRMENARLKEELDRVASLTSKFLGRPFTQMPQGMPQMSVSSLDLSMGGGGPNLDLDLLSGAASSSSQFHLPPPVTEMERPAMAGMATRAMDELVRLAQAGDHVWVKIPGGDGRETLNVETYDNIFSKPGSFFRASDLRVEGTRDSALVCMTAAALADVFMDTSNWMDFFPSIVCNARTVDILVNGINDGRSESLILMYEELHIMTPVVPTREFSFLRYCRQIDQGLWAIADVSVDMQRDVHLGAPPRSRRLPSGCLISDMSNGYSKVTWVEHMEIEEKMTIGPLFRDIVQSGAAFGAHRWLGALQRACERCASLSSLGGMHADAGVTAEGRRSMMKLSQRMVSSFCASMTASQDHQWTHMSGAAGNDVCVRLSMHRNGDPGQPNGVVLSAATSVWLPVPCDHVFAFVRNETTRSQWDVLTHGNQVQEVSRIPNGANPGNCISLLRRQNSMLVVQESCTDASGSLVVYSPIDIPAANVVMSGEDPSGIPLLPSGFTIWPEYGRSGSGVGGGASSSAGAGAGPVAGSIVTVAFQILVSSLLSSKLNAEPIATVSELINNTVRNLKIALNCG